MSRRGKPRSSGPARVPPPPSSRGLASYSKLSGSNSSTTAEDGDLYRPQTAAAVRRGQTIPDDRLARCRTARDELIRRLEDQAASTEVNC